MAIDPSAYNSNPFLLVGAYSTNPSNWRLESYWGGWALTRWWALTWYFTVIVSIMQQYVKSLTVLSQQISMCSRIIVTYSNVPQIRHDTFGVEEDGKKTKKNIALPRNT